MLSPQGLLEARRHKKAMEQRYLPAMAYGAWPHSCAPGCVEGGDGRRRGFDGSFAVGTALCCDWIGRGEDQNANDPTTQGTGGSKTLRTQPNNHPKQHLRVGSVGPEDSGCSRVL